MALMEADTLEVTYSEYRWWAIYLNTFTASDLADAMGVDAFVGEKGIRALLWHGIVEDTGEELIGPYGVAERVLEYVPLPPGPTEHPHEPPVWRHTPGVYDLAPVRGLPIRIRSGRDWREKYAAGSGGARHQMILTEKRYQAQVDAVAARAEKQKRDAGKDPKWKRKK